MNLQVTIDVYAGGQGSGCNPSAGTCGRHKTFYHGTSSRHVSGILKKGILPNRKGADPFTRSGHVYVSDSPSRARTWAEDVAADEGGKPVVMRVRVPADMASGFKKDRTADFYGTKGDRRFEGSIHSKYIKIHKQYAKAPSDDNPEGIP